jgi:hypothetical protein
MFDTLEGYLSGKINFRKCADWRFNCHEKLWRYKETKFFAKHTKSGIWFSCSLPVLLFGSNAKVLRNQGEVDQAVEILKSLIADAGLGEILFISRIDLVCQIKHDPRQLTTAVKESTHPAFRGDQIIYEGGRNYSRGNSQRTIRFTLYDKSLKALKRKSDISRVELQLRGVECQRLSLGLPLSLGHLNFKRGYEAFREFVGHFDRPIEVHTSMSRADSFAMLEARCREAGFSCFDYIALHQRDAATAARFRREVYALLNQSRGVRFGDLFPADAPPQVACHVRQPPPFLKGKKYAHCD